MVVFLFLREKGRGCHPHGGLTKAQGSMVSLPNGKDNTILKTNKSTYLLTSYNYHGSLDGFLS